MWFSAVALGFLSVAIPLQLEKQWITLGWALQGVAVIALWKRLDHPGLKYFGLALLAAVTVRLVANPEILDYYPRSGWPIVNWLMYTYLVPAAALLGAASILRGLEFAATARVGGHLCRRLSGGRGRLRGRGDSGRVCVDQPDHLRLLLGRRPPHRFVRTPGGPRSDPVARLGPCTRCFFSVSVSNETARACAGSALAFLVLTIGKVFLYDLGELEDLYRVASLVGLALSLILVSLAYQRFVFRKREDE